MGRRRRATQQSAQLLRHIEAIDRRKLWAKLGYSSLFNFLVRRYHMSESTAGKRMGAARAARRFPVLFEMVGRGEIHLSRIHHLKAHLTRENHEQVARATLPEANGQQTRHLKASVRREVWPRDQGRCGFVGEDGHRCNETRGLQFAHREPWAKGGANTAENLGLRCPAHNALEADRDYGTRFMAKKRQQKPLKTREPLARYVLSSEPRAALADLDRSISAFLRWWELARTNPVCVGRLVVAQRTGPERELHGIARAGVSAESLRSATERPREPQAKRHRWLEPARARRGANK